MGFHGTCMHPPTRAHILRVPSARQSYARVHAEDQGQSRRKSKQSYSGGIRPVWATNNIIRVAHHLYQ